MPGKEKGVISQLYDEFDNVIVSKVFGDKDLCMIQQFDNWPEYPRLGEEYREKGVFAVQSCALFGWEPLNRVDISLETYPAIGICFLKANSQFLQMRGLQGEHMILAAIQNFIQQVRVPVKARVFGTLGWFETVLVINGKDMSNVLLFANRIRRAVIKMKEGPELPCFETTVTVPAVACQDSGEPFRTMSGPDVNLQTRVSCYSWADAAIKKSLEKYLGEPSYAAGTDDFIVQNTWQSLSEYISKLWDFRKAASGKVYGTYTTFLLGTSENDGELTEVKMPSENIIKYDLQHPRFEKLDKENRTIQQMFTTTYSKLNDILMNVQRSSAIADLRSFADKLLQNIIEPDNDTAVDYIDNPHRLAQQLEMLKFGIEQRCVGMEVGGVEKIHESSHVGDSVGNQRVIAALSSIPIFVMDQLDTKWQGFILYGFAQTYHRFMDGVINVPAEAVSNPNLWFGVFHELGHEYSTKINLMDNVELKAIIAESELEFRSSLEKMSEVYSEIFGCLYGFRGNFSAYLKSTWQYLGALPEADVRFESLLLRFVLTYAIILEDKGNPRISRLGDFTRIAHRLKVKLAEYFPEKQTISNDLIKSLCEEAVKLRPALDIILGLVPEMRHTKLGYARYASEVRKGKVCLEFVDPIAFLYETANVRSELSYSGALSIILSLWNFQIRKLYNN